LVLKLEETEFSK